MRLDRVLVARGGRPILRETSLELGPGEVVGVVGPNGSGKTTLVRLLATLLVPDAGVGEVLGSRLGTPAVYPVRRRIGLIGHVPAVIPELTLEENLRHAARLASVDQSRVGPVLRVVGLELAADRRGDAGSFGMLRRIEVARLLLTRPQLLLLDEAFTGLDQHARRLIDALLERTLAGQGSAVMVSHDETELRRHAQRVYGLVEGRLEVTV